MTTLKRHYYQILNRNFPREGSSLLDVLNQFEVIQLVLLIIMSFFIISLLQNLKGYLNRVHKIFELDLFIVIMIFSNLFLIMTSVLLFLIGNPGIINDMVERISMILVLVYLLFGMGFYICLLYTSPSPRDQCLSRMPSSA